VEDKPEGVGKINYPNGDIYEGEWVGGEKHGQGVYSYNDGGNYSGNWKKMMKNTVEVLILILMEMFTQGNG